MLVQDGPWRGRASLCVTPSDLSSPRADHTLEALLMPHARGASRPSGCRLTRCAFFSLPTETGTCKRLRTYTSALPQPAFDSHGPARKGTRGRSSSSRPLAAVCRWWSARALVHCGTSLRPAPTEPARRQESRSRSSLSTWPGANFDRDSDLTRNPWSRL